MKRKKKNSSKSSKSGCQRSGEDCSINGSALTRPLLDWFSYAGRHDLPWQLNPTPYRVWVSEIMLQQTQVQTVIPYYLRFMAQFPEVSTLAKASEDEVLTAWTGLGYYARARNLLAAAQAIQQRHEGVFPTTYEQILALPGIGRSTAGAILALAFKRPYPILDGNVKRVLTRYHLIEGWPGQADVEKKLWQYATQHTPPLDAAEFTQAIMDLGATVCVRSKPKCAVCPLSANCKAFREQRQSSLPAKKPTKIRPERAKVFLLIRRRGDSDIFLVRRPARGIWGGLWCLPEYTPEQFFDATEIALPGGGVVAQKQCRLHAQFRHQFSHYTLVAEVYTVTLQEQAMICADLLGDEQALWYDFNAPRAIPPPLANVIKETLHHDKNGFLQKA